MPQRLPQKDVWTLARRHNEISALALGPPDRREWHHTLSAFMKAKTPPARHPSIRVLLPRCLNFLLWMSFCAMSGTGLLLSFRLPPGSRGGRGLSALGWDRHAWGDLHTWISYAFILGILVHLALHWRWLWQIAARKRGWPIWIGIGSGLVLMLLLVFQPVR